MSANKQQKERDKAIMHLFDFIDQSEHWSPRFDELTRQLMLPVAHHFDTDVDTLIDRLLDGPHGGMAFGFLMDQMAVTTWNNEEGTPIDAFLKQRGWREGTHGRQYLRALNEADHAFLEVTDVEPGRWVELRPVGSTDKPVRVKERSASQSLHRYDVIVARLVYLGKTTRFSAILPLSPEGAEYLSEQLDAVPGDLAQWYQEAVEEDGPEGLVEHFADEIPDERQRRLSEFGFMCWAIEALDPPLAIAPQMHNTDHERIVMTQYRFPITGHPDTIRQTLTDHPDLIDDSENAWSWLKSDGSNTVLGRLELNPPNLIFHTNSVERGERGVAFIRSLLGDDQLGPPLGVHENLEDLMASSPPTPSSSMSSDELQQLPEVQALLQETMKNHYRKTLDEAIPMLGNESPRACAADPTKRSKVVNWLKYLENTEAKSPNPSQDFGWLWEELDLSDYR